jgi:uncharacterized protein (DUF2236 family)
MPYPDFMAAAPGFFEPGSMMRVVNREAALLVGGPRALLMQLAHPLVAAGVEEHSDFRRDPLGRLFRTLDSMLRIVFGDRDTALAAAHRIDAVHRRVRGVLKTGTCAFPAGTRYDARDPELLLWVHATLVDSALVTYERLIAPLSTAQRAAYYADSKRVGELLGIPAQRLPAELDDFARYLRGMLSGPCLEVTPTARDLADAVLHPPIRLVPRLAGDAASVVTLALLPPTLRERYGLRWSRAHALGADLALRSIRGTLPLLPRAARWMPHARRAA